MDGGRNHGLKVVGKFIGHFPLIKVVPTRNGRADALVR